jgi:hypothetical protein
MLKRKIKERKKSCHFWGLNPRSSVSIHLSVILAYLNTLQSGNSVLGVYYLKGDFAWAPHQNFALDSLATNATRMQFFRSLNFLARLFKEQ